MTDTFSERVTVIKKRRKGRKKKSTMCRSRPVPSDNCQAICHREPGATDVNRIHKGTQILLFSKAASFVFSTYPSHLVAARVSDWTVSPVRWFGEYHYR